MKMEKFKEILLYLEYDKSVRDILIDRFKEIDDIDMISNNAYKKIENHYSLEGEKPIDRLIILIYLSIDLKDRYIKKGIPLEIFKASIDDIKLLSDIFYKENHKYGLGKSNIVWLKNLIDMRIFKLNTLQFQLNHMYYMEEKEGEKYIEFKDGYKEKLPENSPVINIHIQAYADLSPKEVDRSLDMADKFFKEYFPEHNTQAYIMYSWFLYTKTRELLDKDSNIIKFADRFKNIGQVGDNRQTIRRIYGKAYDNEEDYPQETSLQRDALGRFNLLGYACGILIEDK